MGKQLWTCWISHPIKHKLDHNFHVTKSFYRTGPLKAWFLLSPAFFPSFFVKQWDGVYPSGHQIEILNIKGAHGIPLMSEGIQDTHISPGRSWMKTALSLWSRNSTGFSPLGQEDGGFLLPITVPAPAWITWAILASLPQGCTATGAVPST